MGIFKILEVATIIIGLASELADMIRGIRGKRVLTEEELIIAERKYQETIKLMQDNQK